MPLPVVHDSRRFLATVQQFGEQLNYKLPNGEETPNWPAGFYWKHTWCFSGVRELVTKQTVVFDTPVSDVMTKDNIQVQIDVCLQLRVSADAEQGEDPQNLLRFVDKLGVVSLMSQLKDAQAETVRMMARTQTHTSVYGLRAMDTFGKLRKIDLSKLNEDEFGPEAGIKVEKSSAADAVRSALSEIPSAPEMDRLPGSSGAGEAKLGEAKSEEAVVASAQEVEISEHFEGQEMVRMSSDPNDPVMVPSTSDRGRAHDRDDAPQAERAVQRLRHRDHRLADTRR